MSLRGLLRADISGIIYCILFVGGKFPLCSFSLDVLYLDIVLSYAMEFLHFILYFGTYLQRFVFFSPCECREAHSSQLIFVELSFPTTHFPGFFWSCHIKFPMKLELSVSLITLFSVAKVVSITEPNFDGIQVGVELTLTCDTISPSAYPHLSLRLGCHSSNLVLQFLSIIIPLSFPMDRLSLVLLVRLR